MEDENRDRLTAEQIQAIFEGSPFISGLGLQVKSIDYDNLKIDVSMSLSPSLVRIAGTKQFHGGPIASFIDTIGDFAIGMMVGGGVPTMNLRVDYLKPAVGEQITGTAHVRRLGRTIAVVDTNVFDEKNSLVAIGRGTYSSQAG